MIKQPGIARIPILMYHSISNSVNPRFREFAVSPAQFDKQMSYLFQHRYTPVTVTQLATLIRFGTLCVEDRPIVLTFDDGYADFYTHALPILKKYRFTATLYVTAGFVGSTSKWLQREGEANHPMLNWDQLTELASTGVECAAHSLTHVQLDRVSSAVACDEVVRSKRILEEHLPQPVSSFAYPYGYYTDAIERLVREVGYSSACAVKYATSSTTDDLFSLPRLMVTGNTNIDDFAELLNGVRLTSVMKFKQVRSQIWHLVRRTTIPIKDLSSGVKV